MVNDFWGAWHLSQFDTKQLLYRLLPFFKETLPFFLNATHFTTQLPSKLSWWLRLYGKVCCPYLVESRLFFYWCVIINTAINWKRISRSEDRSGQKARWLLAWQIRFLLLVAFLDGVVWDPAGENIHSDLKREQARRQCAQHIPGRHRQTLIKCHVFVIQEKTTLKDQTFFLVISLKQIGKKHISASKGRDKKLLLFLDRDISTPKTRAQEKQRTGPRAWPI